jgi:hypothetical protein
MEEIDSIIEKISALAVKHKAAGDNLDDLEETTWLEEEALMLIAEFCEKTGRIVEGFPHDKRVLAKTDDYYDDEYFCLERFQLYVDTVSLESVIVADLNWHYVNSFWPGEFEDKSDFLESIKGRIESGVFYDVQF